MAGEPEGSKAPSAGGEATGEGDSLLRAVARVSLPRGDVRVEEPDPERIAHFRIAARLGRGGMGIVYRAEDEKLHRAVALKVLPGAFATDEERRRRFLREARAAAAITHPNVATVYDAGEADGRVYIAMELVEGRTLRAELAKGPLSVSDAVRIARSVAQGLVRAHAKGIVHRDLKPDNVMLDEGGEVKILDFGIAKAHERVAGETAFAQADTEAQTREGSVVGTPGYMSPEQARGRSVDARSDLFSLGVVLYEMLTGVPPFGGDTPMDVVIALTRDTPVPVAKRNAAVPAQLERVVERLLEKDPSGRFADAHALLEALDAAVAAAPAAPPRAPAAVRADRTLAVLPIKSSGVPDYVVDGMIEDLIDTLSMTRGLRVRPSGVTARYKGAAADLRDVGRDLGVQLVAEASVRAAGDAYRINARLVGVEDGFQIWAQRFERPGAELLQVIDEVARAIAAAITADLELPSRGSLDPRAAEVYLRARAQLRASWHVSDDVSRVAGMFDEALAHAPRDPHVLSGAAMAHARVAFYGGTAAAAHAETARDLAERAIALAPQLGEPWIAVATLRLDGGDTVGAVRFLRSGLRVAPKTAKAREMLGRILLEAGEVDEAVTLLEEALDLDPSSDEPRWDLARGYALRGEFGRAHAVYDLPVATDAARSMRASMRARMMLWQRLDRTVALPPDEIPPGGIVSRVAEILRRIHATRVFTHEDRAFHDMLIEKAGVRVRLLTLQVLAEVDLAMDDASPGRALAYTRRAVDEGLLDVAWMDRCPLLDALRGLPEWPETRARVDARAAQVRAASRESV